MNSRFYGPLDVDIKVGPKSYVVLSVLLDNSACNATHSLATKKNRIAGNVVRSTWLCKGPCLRPRMARLKAKESLFALKNEVKTA